MFSIQIGKTPRLVATLQSVLAKNQTFMGYLPIGYLRNVNNKKKKLT